MNNPFFAPTIMTDGTVRDSIVDRVEECRPYDKESNSILYHFENLQSEIRWHFQSPNISKVNPIPEILAIAISRVFVENWMARDYNLLKLCSYRDTWSASLWVAAKVAAQVGIARQSIMADGGCHTTRESAINELAHMYADILGYPKTKEELKVPDENSSAKEHDEYWRNIAERTLKPIVNQHCGIIESLKKVAFLLQSVLDKTDKDRIKETKKD